MRMLRIFCFLVFSVTLVSLPEVWAQPEKSGQGTSQRLGRLIQQVESIEKKYEELLARQDEIIAEIKNLKIQARR